MYAIYKRYLLFGTLRSNVVFGKRNGFNSIASGC